MKGGTLFVCFLICFFFGLSAGATYPQDSESYNRNILMIVHPVHLSFTNIEYVEGDNKFKILFKLFVDDFDLVLKMKYGKELKLTEGRWGKDHLETINRYILEHFKLIIGGKDRMKPNLKFSKKEVEEQSIWLYYDYGFKGKDNNFEIYNSLMTDLYQDQDNLLIFTFKGEQKALKFDVNKTKEELRF